MAGQAVVRVAYAASAVLWMWPRGIVLLHHNGGELLSRLLLEGKESRDMSNWYPPMWFQKFPPPTLDDIANMRDELKESFISGYIAEMGRMDPVPPGIDGAVLANVTDQELVDWFVEHGWRQSKQELVERFRRDFIVVKKHE